jgi:hypothetical protein
MARKESRGPPLHVDHPDADPLRAHDTVVERHDESWPELVTGP